MKVADYELVADSIRTLTKNPGLKNAVARHFADRLKQHNQRFDRAKFLTACGYVEHEESDE